MGWMRGPTVPRRGLESPDPSLERDAQKLVPVPPIQTTSKSLPWVLLVLAVVGAALLLLFLVARG